MFFLYNFQIFIVILLMFCKMNYQDDTVAKIQKNDHRISKRLILRKNLELTEIPSFCILNDSSAQFINSLTHLLITKIIQPSNLTEFFNNENLNISDSGIKSLTLKEHRYSLLVHLIGYIILIIIGLLVGIFLIFFGSIVFCRLLERKKVDYSHYRHPYSKEEVIEDPLFCGNFIVTVIITIFLFILFFILFIWLCTAVTSVHDNLNYAAVEGFISLETCFNISLDNLMRNLSKNILDVMDEEEDRITHLQPSDDMNTATVSLFDLQRKNLLNKIEKNRNKVEKEFLLNNPSFFFQIFTTEQLKSLERILWMLNSLMIGPHIMCILFTFTVLLLYMVGLALYLVILSDVYLLSIEQDALITMNRWMVLIFRVLSYFILLLIGLMTLIEVVMFALVAPLYGEIGINFSSYINGDTALEFFSNIGLFQWSDINDVPIYEFLIKCNFESFYRSLELYNRIDIDSLLYNSTEKMFSDNLTFSNPLIYREIYDKYSINVARQVKVIFNDSNCYYMNKLTLHSIYSLSNNTLLTLCSIVLIFGLLIFLTSIIFAIVFRLTGKFGEAIIIAHYNRMPSLESNWPISIKVWSSEFQQSFNKLHSPNTVNKNENKGNNNSNWGVFVSPHSSLNAPPVDQKED